jgi:uncharacterized protein with FMN-binding domain
MNHPTGSFSPVRTVRKFFVSAFVVFTFVAYALHEHFVNPDAATNVMASQGASTTQQLPPAPPTDSPGAPPTDPLATAAPMPTAPVLARAAPTTAPTPTARAKGQYRDGVYTGPEADAFWGLVQIRATIRNGKIADVQFLQYPSDRRTSQRINNVAIPYLKTEAMQVQSANVDIISGATLTSEAFAQSLQAALDTAKN